MIATMHCRTPLGTLLLSCTEDALTSARFVDDERTDAGDSTNGSHPVLTTAAAALARYFARDAVRADLPLAPAGTAFQRRVWSAVGAVPAGTTATYLDIAIAIGAPRSVRAVGAAIGRNPLAIFIPCHRVVGSDGALTGYAWGLERKQALLELERAAVARELAPA